MKTREQIITSMCYTWRHDYGLEKEDNRITSGMTKLERESLWQQMAQLFDNDIAPYMNFKKQWLVKLEEDGDDVIVPLPEELLKEMNWNEGDDLTFELKDNKINIRKANDT